MGVVGRPAAHLVDCSGQALLAGASLGSLFNLPPKIGRWKRADRACQVTYMAGMSVTLAHCIMVVFLCTITTTSIMLNSVSMRAENVESVMNGVLRMEYTSCRAFFLTSLTAFLTAVAAKVFSTFVGPATSKQDLLFGSALVSFFVHTVAAQQAYTNSVISASLGNLGVLYVHAMQLWLRKFHLFSGIAGFVQSAAYFTFVGLLAARLICLMLEK